MNVHFTLFLENVTAHTFDLIAEQYPDQRESIEEYRRSRGVEEDAGPTMMLEKRREMDQVPRPGELVCFSANFEDIEVQASSWNIYDDDVHYDVLLGLVDADEVGDEATALEMLVKEGWAVVLRGEI